MYCNLDVPGENWVLSVCMTVCFVLDLCQIVSLGEESKVHVLHLLDKLMTK